MVLINEDTYDTFIFLINLEPKTVKETILIYEIWAALGINQLLAVYYVYVKPDKGNLKLG